jgi:hypothetical protein
MEVANVLFETESNIKHAAVREPLNKILGHLARDHGQMHGTLI